MSDNKTKAAEILAEYVTDDDGEWESLEELIDNDGEPENSPLYHAAIIQGTLDEFYNEVNQIRKGLSS